MKRTLIFIVFISINLFLDNSYAQTGWQWGINCKHSNAFYSEVVGATVADRSGNVFTLGSFSGDSITFGSILLAPLPGPTTMVVAKADSSGNYVWAKALKCHRQVGEISIAVDRFGALYLYGYYWDSCSIDTFRLRYPTGFDPMTFLVKIGPSGNVLWAKNICSGGISIGTAGFSIGTIDIDNADNVILQGVFTYTNDSIGSFLLHNNTVGTYSDIYMAKVSPGGSVLWAKSFGGNNDDAPTSMAMNSDGSFYISGITRSDTLKVGSQSFAIPTSSPLSEYKATYLMKFSVSGSFIWGHILSDHIEIRGMTTDKYGFLYLCGSSDSITSISGHALSWAGAGSPTSKKDILFAKYDGLGNNIWAKSYGTPGQEFGMSIAADSCGKIWMAGQMAVRQTLHLDADSLTPSIWSYDPSFFAESDTSGAIVDALSLFSGGDDQLGITVDRRGNFYTSGDYVVSGSEPFIIGTDTFSNITGSSEILFIGKYRYDISKCNDFNGSNDPTTAIQNIQEAGLIQMYPNPANTKLTLASRQTMERVSVADPVGHEVFSKRLADNIVELDISDLPNGLYFVTVNGTNTIKLIKQ